MYMPCTLAVDEGRAVFFCVGFHVITLGVCVGGSAGEVWMIGMDARERVAVCTYLEPACGKLLA